MDILLRCVVLSLAAFGVTHALTSIAVASRISLRRPSEAPADRADRLLGWQLLPTAVAGFILVFAATGLYRFESREADEVIGRSLWLGAALGGSLILLTMARLAHMHWQTAGLLRVWFADATSLARADVPFPTYVINTGYPVVAVIGVLRPRLVIDAQVLRACSDEELRAILAHERGHVRRWDNLRRTLFAAVPGPWFSRDLPQAWREATEEAADDLAAQTGQETRFHLATALLRVSRLAPGPDVNTWQAHLPASALYRGESIERRVRRLVEAPESSSRRRRHWASVVAAGLMTIGFILQRELHDVMENVVAILP